MFTSKLHNLCQKLWWAAPVYTDRREGPDHEPTFHATVAVGRAEFRSPAASRSRTRNQARDLAARAAFEDLAGWEAPPQLLPETQVPFKSQLQDYAQKTQKDLPMYHTTQSGLLHPPMFRSTVIIDGRTFESPQDCSTKKKAEPAAAAAALMALADQAKPLEKLVQEVHKNPRRVLPEKEGCPKSTVHITEECFQGEPSKKQKQMHVAELDFQHSQNTTATPVACAKCGCSKPTEQIKVYRRHPEMVLPDGATILPFSDDEWVAVRLPSPQP